MQTVAFKAVATTAFLWSKFIWYVDSLSYERNVFWLVPFFYAIFFLTTKVFENKKKMKQFCDKTGTVNFIINLFDNRGKIELFYNRERT